MKIVFESECYINIFSLSKKAKHKKHCDIAAEYKSLLLSDEGKSKANFNTSVKFATHKVSRKARTMDKRMLPLFRTTTLYLVDKITCFKAPLSLSQRILVLKKVI